MAVCADGFDAVCVKALFAVRTGVGGCGKEDEL